MRRSLALALLPLAWAAPLQAFMCGGFIEPPLVVEGQAALTETELLRHNSISIANSVHGAQRQDNILVIGRFSRNTDVPLLHQEQLSDIRGRYWPPDPTVEMPYEIQYFYRGAYSFEGQQIIDGTASTYLHDELDARVSISAEYEGIVDILPPTDADVIGVLHSINDGQSFEVSSWTCPTYTELDPDQREDLLACYAEGACQ